MASNGEDGQVQLQVPLSAGRAAREVPALDTRLTWRDVLGGWRVRWGIGRGRYRVEPGLYRIGTPDPDSPVLVTASYKLTVDKLRQHLGGLDLWLLVLDTRGVNVWCAAGKGTFGTQELVARVHATGLARIVRHRHLIVPQLGATGVAAHEVKRGTTFQVHFGPVLARDIPAYLAAGLRATPAMRRVPFGWKERIVLAPVEIVGAWKPLAVVLLVLGVLDLIRHHALTPHVIADFLPFLAAVLTGGLLVPLLLPWLPSRAFAVKGAIAGALCAAATVLLIPMGALAAVGTSLLVIAISSYMAMTFTGSSTFTTLGGTRLEVKRGLPPILASAVLGALLRVTAAFV